MNIRLCRASLSLFVLLLSSLLQAQTVYHESGKKRVHVAECRRYKRLDNASKAGMTTMSLNEAKAKGLSLCSRCPGSDTEGKNKKETGPESWVNPPPEDVTQVPFSPSPLAPLISMGSDGKLMYKPYSEKGDMVMDWSHVGYKNSAVPIPDAKVVRTLNAPDGSTSTDDNMKYPLGPDSRAEIQTAINEVAAMPANTEGLKGAVLLKAGTYFLNGGLVVPSGVVLRGEGDGDNGTVLIMRSAEGGGNAIHLGEPEGKVDATGEAQAVRIVDDYVPSGSLKLTLENTDGLQEGDYIHVRKTPNQAWIDHLGMGERLRHIRGGKEGMNKRPWKPESYRFRHLRKIVNIEGNTITLDAILPQSFDQEHGSGDVYKVDVSSLATHSGVEFLQVISNYDTTVKDESKQSNFFNFRSGISVQGAYDSWVRGVTVQHVSFAAVNIGSHTRQITVRDCKNLKPVGPKRGGNRYAFNISGGTLHLFYNCFSEDGRHDFALGSRETGPFAFVRCEAVRGGQSEPHHRWSTGILYDNVITKDGTLAAINRGDSGSGHGWAAANTLFWNCDAKSIVVMDPETQGENNFAIGYKGTFDESTGTRALMYANTRAGYWGTPQEGKFYGYALMGNGYIESPDKPVSPDSLFEQQLIERIGEASARTVLQ
jgi:hypothetical protein